MLKYKDYLGSVTFADGKLIVKILHIEDSISDECDSAADAQGCFAALVDDYIETCALVGKEPSKPFKGTFNVRMSPSTHRRAAMAATESGKSLNAYIEEAVEHRLTESRSTISLKDLSNALRLPIVNSAAEWSFRHSAPMAPRSANPVAFRYPRLGVATAIQYMKEAGHG